MHMHSLSADARRALVASVWGGFSSALACLLFLGGLSFADIHRLGSLIGNDPLGLDWISIARITLVFGLVGFVTAPALAGPMEDSYG